MAVQNPFFGKREPESFQRNAAPGANLAGVNNGTVGAVLPVGVSTGMGEGLAGHKAVVSAEENAGSKLTVGPNIKLRGVEITDCDTLVVEGLVEATMDSRVIQIAEQGAFKGSAEIDVAEIHGEFNGNLTVRDRLTIFSTGKVTGVIRYGKLVVEEGGQLSGEIQFGTQVGAKPASAGMAKTGLQPA